MKTVAAIDFGTSKIVFLLAEGGGFSRCDIVGSGTVPYDGYMDGAWNVPDEVAPALREAIAAAETESKRRIAEAYVGVPCAYFNVMTKVAEVQIQAADGRVSEDDTDAVQDAAAEALGLISQGGVVIHRSPAWFSVDGGKNTMSPIGVRGNTLRAQVSFLIADPEFIHDARRLLGEIGVTALAFLAPTMGTALLLLSPDERDRVAVLVDVGYLNTEVSVVEGDAIIYHAILPMGAGHIAADLAMALGIPLADAEQIKRDYIFMPDEFDAVPDPQVREPGGAAVTFPLEFVKKTIESAMDELIEMIDATVKHARSKDMLKSRSQIYLTGGGVAMMRGGREYLAEKLGMPVKIPMARAAKLNSPRYASALGLVDLIYNSIEQQTSGEDTIASKLTGGIKNLFGR